MSISGEVTGSDEVPMESDSPKEQNPAAGKDGESSGRVSGKQSVVATVQSVEDHKLKNCLSMLTTLACFLVYL